jgi:hypothetical protein
MTDCALCGGYGNRHDPIAHNWVTEEWPEDLCKCGHGLERHDMGHGCIECRCRGWREAT